jgi:hypothetical protein
MSRSDDRLRNHQPHIQSFQCQTKFPLPSRRIHLPHVDEDLIPAPVQHSYRDYIVQPSQSPIRGCLKLPPEQRPSIVQRRPFSLNVHVSAVIRLNVVACIRSELPIDVRQAPVRADVKYFPLKRMISIASRWGCCSKAEMYGLGGDAYRTFSVLRTFLR